MRRIVRFWVLGLLLVFAIPQSAETREKYSRSAFFLGDTLYFPDGRLKVCDSLDQIKVLGLAFRESGLAFLNEYLRLTNQLNEYDESICGPIYLPVMITRRFGTFSVRGDTYTIIEVMTEERIYYYAWIRAIVLSPNDRWEQGI